MVEPPGSHEELIGTAVHEATRMKPGPDSRKRRIFIVDDHPLVREWLASLINQQQDLRVCGEADNGSKALELILAAKPDIAVVDISLTGNSGIELIKNLKTAAPQVAVLVLTMHDESLYAERALLAGAQGYVVKREATKKVLVGIRSVLAGKLYVSDAVRRTLAKKPVEGQAVASASPIQRLSDRELEVFQFLGRGFGTRRIADEMRVSFKTVQSFCARIKEKLKLGNATELLREAIRWHQNQQTK